MTGALQQVRPADIRLKLGMDFPILAAAYCRWRAEGLFEQIFHRTPNISLIEFLDWCYLPTVEPVGVFAGESLVGVGWIVQARQIDGQVVAEVGAAFFKGTPLSAWRRALHLFMDHAFVDRGFAEVYGVSAKDNRAARVIRRWCGMRPVERLPWEMSTEPDAVVYALNWKEWAGRIHHG